jgi:hypothetical protein
VGIIAKSISPSDQQCHGTSFLRCNEPPPAYAEWPPDPMWRYQLCLASCFLVLGLESAVAVVQVSAIAGGKFLSSRRGKERGWESQRDGPRHVPGPLVASIPETWEAASIPYEMSVSLVSNKKVMSLW